jgi:hypothetical protein
MELEEAAVTQSPLIMKLSKLIITCDPRTLLLG